MDEWEKKYQETLEKLGYFRLHQLLKDKTKELSMIVEEIQKPR